MSLLAGGLVDRGNTVTVVACRRSAGPDVELPPDVDLVRFDRARTRNAVLDVRELIASRSIDVVVGTMEHGDLTAVAAAVGTGIPVIATFHGDPILGREQPGVFGWTRPFIAGMLVRMTRNSVAVSPSLMHVLRGLAPGHAARIIHIPNAVLSPALYAAAQEQTPSFTPGRYILWAGRMVPEKDPVLMVRTASLIHKRDPSISCVMLGDGPLAQEVRTEVLRQELADKFLLPGHVSNPYPWMRAAEAFVLTSRREGLGNVLVEAGALRTPVVSVDCPSGPADVLRNRPMHRLVQERSPKALAEAVWDSLAETHPDQRESWAEYEVGIVSERFERVLRSAVTRRRFEP